MLVANTQCAGHHDLQYDIASYVYSKQAKRRQKKSKDKLSIKSPKNDRVTNFKFYNKKLNDKKENKKSMKILNDRYIDIELKEYISDKPKESKSLKEALKSKEAEEGYDETTNDSTATTPSSNSSPIKPPYSPKLAAVADADIYHHSINKRKISWSQKCKLTRDANEERELLISGYCKEFIPKQMNNIIYTTLIKNFVVENTKNTKRAIASANFIAECIDKYQNAKRNQCPFMKDNTKKDKINLLDYIYIRGGAFRDILLNRDINDIDLVVETNTLNKLYFNHLKKYHSKPDQQRSDCTCYLWRLYLKMYADVGWEFYSIDYSTSDPIKKLETYLVKAPFLMNAVFIKEIIINSNQVNVVRIAAINTWGYTNWVLQVRERLMYQGVNLNDARFDLGDQMSLSDGMREIDRSQLKNINKPQPVEEIVDIKKHSAWNKHCHYLFTLGNQYGFMRDDNRYKDEDEYTIQIKNELTENYHLIHDGNNNDKAIKIHLPHYAFNMKYSTQFCDFTINGIRLPLSKIYNANKSKYRIDYNWYDKVMQYSYSGGYAKSGDKLYQEHNRLAIQCINDKIIMQPHLNALTPIFVYQDYFWRFVKICCKFAYYVYNDEWHIDKDTLLNMQEACKVFFERGNTNYFEFANRLLIWDIKQEITNYEFERKLTSRLMVFKIIGFEPYFNKMIQDNSCFLSYLRRIMLRRFSAEKRNATNRVFKSFGYGIEIHPDPPRQARERRIISTRLIRGFGFMNVGLYYRVYTETKGKRGNLWKTKFIDRKWKNNHNKRKRKEIKKKKKIKNKKKTENRQYWNLYVKDLSNV